MATVSSTVCWFPGVAKATSVLVVDADVSPNFDPHGTGVAAGCEAAE